MVGNIKKLKFTKWSWRLKYPNMLQDPQKEDNNTKNKLVNKWKIIINKKINLATIPTKYSYIMLFQKPEQIGVKELPVILE